MANARPQSSYSDYNDTAASAQFATSCAVPTEIGRIATVLPAGNNTIIAVVELNSTDAGTENVLVGNLRVVNNQTGELIHNNTVPLSTGVAGTNSPYFIIANKTNAAANEVYTITACSGAVAVRGEAKIAVLNNITQMRVNDTGQVNETITTAEKIVKSLYTGFPAGNNTIMVAITLDGSAGAAATIPVNNLSIRRGTTTLDSNNFAILLTTALPGDKYSVLLIARDDAPANAVYDIYGKTSASVAGISVSVAVFQAPNYIFESSKISITTSNTLLANITTDLNATSEVVVLVTTEINDTNTTIDALPWGGGYFLNESTLTKSMNEFAVSAPVAGPNAAGSQTAAGLLWRNSNVAENASYLLYARASAGGLDSVSRILVIVVNQSSKMTTLRVNGTLTDPTTVLTGENTTFTGNCEVINGNGNNVNIILQNSTNNITFTEISTLNTQPIYANVSSYTIGTLAGNSSRFLFQVNATVPRANYTLRVQCNATDTEPLAANTTGANLTVNQAFGRLNVTLITPVPDTTTNVVQNKTFILKANVTCDSSNPTALCDEVNGTARFNLTLADPDTQISNTSGDTPLWANFGNKTCGRLNYLDFCTLNWTVNATGAIGTDQKVGVLFYSNNSGVTQNHTGNATLAITSCSVDFTLQWSLIEFGNLAPSTTGNPAPGNAADSYNITINQGSCDLDFYIRGTNLTSVSTGENITVQNLSWNNLTNDYPSSFRLDYSNTPLENAVPQLTNITTWYWIDVPALFADVYNGTIYITGVIDGNPP